MASNERFQKAIADLQGQLDACQAKVSLQDNCVSALIVIGVVTPIVLFLLLYFIQPRFVTSKQGDQEVRDKMKLFLWTVGVTLVVWIALYLYAYFNNYAGLPMVCAR